MPKNASLLLLLLIVLASPTVLPAQTPGAPQPAAQPGRISGEVADADGRRLETVAITLRSATDSAVVTGALTDRSGRFRVDGLAPGGYLLRVSMVGYLPRNSEEIVLTAESPAVDLGVIVLEVSAIELDAIEAVAERAAMVVEADRTVYNTAAMPVASSGTATDVLRAVPELEVDVNNNVKLRGNQTVAVHLNGRPTPMRGEQLANFLQQLPGNRIDRVEVMPNPSARHDPEGIGGIVNIVLKENADLGLSGSASVNASTRNRQYANGRLNYQRGRITLFSGAGASTFRQWSANYDLRENLVTTPVTFIEQTTASDFEGLGWNADWTVELRVGRQATLWSNAWMFFNSSDSNADTEYSVLDDAQVVSERYDRLNDNEMTFGNYNFGFGFKQIFQPQREELTIDGRITRGENDGATHQLRIFHLLAGAPVDTSPELLLNDIDSGNGTVSIQADYNRRFGDSRIEAGYRAWQRTQDNDNRLRIFESADATEPMQEMHAAYDFTETFHSLYGTYSRTLGRFTVQGGLRAEYTSRTFESGVFDATFDRDYTTLFPSFSASFSPAQGRTARFQYSRRISRPMPFYLDPFVPPTDPLNRNIGNPELRPTLTNSVSLDYSITGGRGTLRVAPYYRQSTDVWERIRTVDEDGVATSRWENGRSSNAYGSNFTLSLPPSGRVSGSVNLNVYRDVRDGTNIGSGYRRAAMLWSAGGNISAKLTSSLTAQLFGNHFPMQSILQGRASGYTFTSLSVRQQLGGPRSSISLQVMDPFNLYRYNSSTSDPTYHQTSRSTARMRVATLGFTYNFGRPPQQQSRRQAGPEEAGETIRVR
jgi:hypothetical protein